MADSDAEDIYEIERILSDDRVDGQTFYLVKWKGYPDEQCTWEPAESFTSEHSIQEWQQQSAQGDRLPDDFLADLQKRMDEYQELSRQSDEIGMLQKAATTESDDPPDPPLKSQNQTFDTVTPHTVRSSHSTSNATRKRGIAIMAKKPPEVATRSESSSLTPTRSAKRTTNLKLGRPFGSTNKTSNPRLQQAGQRFRNLSHMNNYRKKARAEPAPNLPPERLKSVSDFDIGRQTAHILPPALERVTTEHNVLTRGESSLFIPDTSGFFDRRPTSPVSSESVIFPPAKVDHIVDVAPNIDKPSNGPYVKANSAVRLDTADRNVGTGLSKYKSSTTYELAKTPSPHLIRSANNGRWWYRGDIMCNFAMGRPIGDATIIHVPFSSVTTHILDLKSRGQVKLDFEPHPYDRGEFEQAFQNHYVSPQMIGLISPFEDTQRNFDEFAEYLESNDCAAVFQHPDSDVNLSLLLYSFNAPSWSFIGWKPARVGQPRLHVAFLPKLIRRASVPFETISTQSPCTVAAVTQLNQGDRDTGTKNPVASIARQRTKSLSECREKSPSFPHDVMNLDVKQKKTPRSPSAHSEAYKSLPESPAVDWTSVESTPMDTTPESPRSAYSTIRDPRIRRRSSISDRPHDTNLATSESNMTGTLAFCKLDYKYLVGSTPLTKKTNLDPRKAQFFISFARSSSEEASMIQLWLEKHTAASSIYLDSERHDWTRFKEKAPTTFSVLLFHESCPSYQKLPGLGKILFTEGPSCFSITFQGDNSLKTTEPYVRLRRLFPRMTLYLITESMITHYLEDTIAVIHYFNISKKPGYKMMMRPQIERWLVKYCAEEMDDKRQRRLIDLLVLIRSLRPTTDSVIDTYKEDGNLAANDTKVREAAQKNNYIISPANIGLYDEVKPMISVASTTKDNGISAQENHKDDILKAYFYCYAATKATSFRRFICFVPKKEYEEHVKKVKQKEKDNTLDNGHIFFWELEKFVHEFCNRSSRKRSRSHGQEAVNDKQQG